jgi:hypothetical protein
VFKALQRIKNSESHNEEGQKHQQKTVELHAITELYYYHARRARHRARLTSVRRGIFIGLRRQTEWLIGLIVGAFAGVLDAAGDRLAQVAGKSQPCG